jgi:hypothetical protein
MIQAPGGQSSDLYLNVVHFFSTSVNLTYVAAIDSCFPAKVFNVCCSLATFQLQKGAKTFTITTRSITTPTEVNN